MPQAPATATDSVPPRRFEFSRDTFAFANELAWEYGFPADGGRPRMTARVPRPSYTLRCFVLVRAAKRFFLHADFRPGETPLSPEATRDRVRAVLRRQARLPSAPDRRIVIPGYAGLREFSRAREDLLKAECGGAWRSYVLRSHWRMVFPISRDHQRRTASGLAERLAGGLPATVHLVRFPQLTINHGMTVYDVEVDSKTGASRFRAYDPNDPEAPAVLTFDPAASGFTLPPNRYWAGGELDVLEIDRSWWF